MSSKLKEYEKYDELVKQQFDKLVELSAPICRDDEELEEIRKTFYFARDAHKGVLRK